MDRDWDAVAAAINDRLTELHMTQQELAKRSGVSPATLRQLQHNYAPMRRSARTLAAISQGLAWPPEYLAGVADRKPPEHAGDVRADIAALRAEVSELRERLGTLEEAMDR